MGQIGAGAQNLICLQLLPGNESTERKSVSLLGQDELSPSLGHERQTSELPSVFLTAERICV